MRQGRKETAWCKNRKPGSIRGGRNQLKIPNKVFTRLHSISPPTKDQELPLIIEDNCSREFFFPFNAQEILEALSHLPTSHTSGLTHLWLRRIRKRDYKSGNFPFGSYICGSGVRLIVLYPWPQDMTLRFGKKRPLKKVLNNYKQWTEDLFIEDGKWCLRWTEEAIKRFYIEDLLFHEVGHHVDYYYRRWSEANLKQVEEFACQYAIHWSQKKKHVFSAIETEPEKT